MALERLTRAERVRRRPEFQQAFERGLRSHGRHLTLVLAPNTIGTGRLGIVASRKLGGAIARNRAKRIVRNVFRRNKIARGLDIVVIPRPSLVTATLAEVEADYRAALQRHVRRHR
jgi:ribonuclease P protein component